MRTLQPRATDSVYHPSDFPEARAAQRLRGDDQTRMSAQKVDPATWSDSAAYLSIQAPKEVNIRYGEQRARVLLDTPTQVVQLELRANGRLARVPYGLVYLTLEPGTDRTQTVGLEL